PSATLVSSLFFIMIPLPADPTLFPYTTLFRSLDLARLRHEHTILKSLDVPCVARPLGLERYGRGLALVLEDGGEETLEQLLVRSDRKSTRLNSSHVKISYAVFCLKKKTRRQFS